MALNILKDVLKNGKRKKKKRINEPQTTKKIESQVLRVGGNK
jgi:hypothetical protein